MPEDILINQVLPALRELREELPATERRINSKLRRYMLLVTAFLFVSSLTLAAAGFSYVREANQSACESSNEVRSAMLTYLDQVLAPAPLPPAPTQAQIESYERRQGYVATARDSFRSLDC